MLNLALALVMFGIALEIKLSDFKELFRQPKKVLTGIFSQFILLPLLTILLIFLLEPLPSIALGMILVAACPGGNVSNFMSHLSGGNTALSISLTAFATLFAVFMTPLNFNLYGAFYGPTAALLKDINIDLLQMAVLVAVLLGLPLLAGLWVQWKNPGLAKAMARWFKWGSLIFFVALIFLALAQNLEVMENYLSYVFWIVLIHNLLALASGNFLARLMKLPKSDRKTITLETGIQNSGLGLLLIFSFFDGLGGMALVAAFWGIWHLIAGLLLSLLWGFGSQKEKEWI